MPILLRRQASTLVTPAPVLSEGVGTPLWWVYRLTQRLQAERLGVIEITADGTSVYREGLAKLERYDDGNFDLPGVSDPEVREAFLQMLNRSRSNFMRLVTNAEAERCNVLGLRIPGDNEVADTETWDIWERNDMPFWAPIGFRTAFVQRRSYLSVWWDESTPGRARIAVEDPQQCIVEHVPGDRTRRAAGLKWWVDDWTGEQHANLYLPGWIYYMRWGKPSGGVGPEGWYTRQAPVENKLGVVPLIPLVNQPSLRRNGVSELEDLIPIQDRINQTLFNRQVAEHLSAFRQKWATGLEIPLDEAGQPVQTYQAALDKLWVSPEPGSKFGQFDETDLANYHKTIEQDLEHLSVISRTPRHVFMHQGQAPSGDAMKSDEAGLVAKVKGAWNSFGSGILETLALARQIENLTTPMGSEIVWADPEWQTYAQLVDGTVKLVDSQLASRDWGREKIGMSPATIARVKREILQDSLIDGVLAPEPDAAPVAP